MASGAELPYFSKAGRNLHICPATVKAKEMSVQITEATSRQSHPVMVGFRSLLVRGLSPPREIIAGC